MPDRSVLVRIGAIATDYDRTLATSTAATKAWVHELEEADGRLSGIVQTGLALAPALVPLGAVAVPAVAALTSNLGFLALGFGVVLAATQGVGDALDALNKYQLDPTAENFQALQQAMSGLSPAARDFVIYLDQLEPQLKQIRDLAATGIFPGVEEGIDALLTRGPQASRVVQEISDEIGHIAADAGRGLAGPEWDDFFAMVERDGVPTLAAMATSLGNVATGLGNVLVAFSPLTRDFDDGMVSMSKSFERWSEGLADSQGFEDFTAYVRTEGPEVIKTLAAIADAGLEIVEAAAPVGAHVLPVLQDVADVLGRVADSPAGPALITVAAGVGTLGRSLAILRAVGLRGDKSALSTILDTDSLGRARTSLIQAAAATDTLTNAQAAASRQAELYSRGSTGGLSLAAAYAQESSAAERSAAAQRARGAALREAAGTAGKTAAVIGGLALVTNRLDDSADRGTRAIGAFGDVAGGALLGFAAGGPIGAAVGGGAAAITTLVGALHGSDEAAKQAAQGAAQYADTLDQVTGAATAETRALIAQRLEQDGVLASAQKLGIDTQTLVEAISGQGSAADELSHTFDQLQQKYTGVGDAAQTTGQLLKTGLDPQGLLGQVQVVDQAQQKYGDLLPVLQKVRKAYGDQASEVTAGAAAVRRRADATGQSTRATEQDTRSTQDNTRTIKANVAAMQQARQARLTAANAELGYRQAILDARSALKQNGKTLDESTQKGIDNRRALLNLAESWNAQSAAVKNTAGAHRAAVSTFVAVATQMGLNATKAHALAQRYLEIPPKRETTITLHDSQFAAAIAEDKARLDKLQSKTVTITYNHAGRPPGPGGEPMARGGPVFGGIPDRDSVPALLMPGEFVARKAAVDRYGIAMFHRLNAMSMPVPAFATGGLVGRLQDAAASGQLVLRVADDGPVHGPDTPPDPGGGLYDPLDKLKKKIAEVTDALGKQKDRLHSLEQAQASYASQVSQAYVSDPFQGTLAGFDAQTSYETRNLRAVDSDLDRLRHRGGKRFAQSALYKQLAASGNQELIDQFSQLSGAELRQREDAFARRNRLDRRLGEQSAKAVYDTRIGEQLHEVREIRRVLHRLEDRQKGRDKHHDDGHGGHGGHDGHGGGQGGGNGGGHGDRFTVDFDPRIFGKRRGGRAMTAAMIRRR